MSQRKFNEPLQAAPARGAPAPPRVLAGALARQRVSSARRSRSAPPVASAPRNSAGAPSPAREGARAPRAWRAALHVLFTIVALCVSGALRAEETPNQDPVPNPTEREVVIVPYDPKVKPADQNPDHLYLPYERFLQLWEAAKEHKRPQPADEAPLPYSLTSAHYEARLEARGLTVMGQIDLFTGAAWVKVPLPFPGAKVSSLTVDGLAANWTADALLVEKAGRHQVKIAFDLPRAEGAVDFRWGVPRATAAVLALTMPQAETTATIEPGSGAVERVEGGARIVTAALGSATEVRIQLRTAEQAAAAGAPVSASVDETARLSATWEEFQADVEFTFPSAVQDHFTVSLEKGLTLTDLSAPNLKSWTLRPEGERQALDLVLYEPAHETLTVHLAAQRLPAAAGDEVRSVPLFSTNAGRTELTSLALLSPERATVTPMPGAGWRQISWDKALPAGWRLAGAFAGSGTLPYRLAATPSRREARVEYLYQVGRRQLELFASMELLAQGEPLQTVQLDLPPGFEIETLQSGRPHTWWRTAGSLVVSFQDATPPSTRLVLHLVQKAPPAAAALEIRSLHLVDFHRVSSEVAVAAHMGVEASLTLPAQTADVPPAEAAASFQVLPPLRRQRGFRVPEGDFIAQVKLVPLAPRLEAIWALRAEAHEAWLGLSYAVRLSVTQGSVDRARFTLPATLPEARIGGSEVREARSQVAGDVRIYDVEFQNEVYSQVEFSIDLEQPHAGEAALPALLFPGLPRAAGFLAVENASEGEMRFTHTGLEKAAVAELPWAVPSAARAQLFRVPPAGWTAAVAVERLEKATGRLAFCPRAEISTAFRRDGATWHKAVWHLQNRALQFLPVRLPAGAELVSVRVAGQSVRADSGPAAGGPALLIPLIKTKPGELSYDVEAVYRTAEPALAGSTKRTLDDPDLVGITVERTVWNVWAPAGFEIRAAAGGNMERIIQEVAVADKFDDTLQELKTLNGIISLSRAGSDTRNVAVDNFRRLQTELSQPPPARTEFRNDKGVKKGEIAGQNSYVENKVQEVNKELEKQVQQLNGTVALDAPSAPLAFQSTLSPRIDYGVPIPNNALPNATSTFVDPNGNGWKLNSAKNTDVSATIQSGKDEKAPQQLALNDNVVLNYNDSMDFAKGGLNSARGDVYDEERYPNVSGSSRLPQQPLSAARAWDNFHSRQTDSAAETRESDAQLTAGASRLTLSGTNTYSGKALVGSGTLTFSGGTVSVDAITPQSTAPRNLPGASATPPPIRLPSDVPPPTAQPLPIRLQNGAVSPEYFTSFDKGVVDRSKSSSPAAREAVQASPRPAATPPDRRITLAVDFPTEGEPIHFKKLKAAATLRVELEPRETFHRERNAFILAIAAALLIWARRRFAREPEPAFSL